MKIFFLSLLFVLMKPAFASNPGIILNGYAAYDYCSCRFVVGLKHKECKKRIGVGFPLPHGKIRVDEKNKVISVGKNKPENIRISYYVSERLGCRLLSPDEEI